MKVKLSELHCSYLPESKSGTDASGLKVQGTLHWVSKAHAIPVELSLYDRLFKVENPATEEGDFKDYINPDSLANHSNCIRGTLAGRSRARRTLSVSPQRIFLPGQRKQSCKNRFSTEQSV